MVNERSGMPVRFRSAKRVELLEVQVAEGDGITGDPVRLVTYYCSLDGAVLAVAGEAVA